LTGGRFDLLEGQRAEAAKDEILSGLLGTTLEDGMADELLHVFRRATIGREDAGGARSLGNFIQSWHGRLRSSPGTEWGPAALSLASLDAWEERKHDLVAKIRRSLGDVEWTVKNQPEAMEKMLDHFLSHTTGSGSLDKGGALLECVLEAAALG